MTIQLICDGMCTCSTFIETLECHGAAGHDPSDSMASDNSKLPRSAAIFSSANAIKLNFDDLRKIELGADWLDGHVGSWPVKNETRQHGHIVNNGHKLNGAHCLCVTSSVSVIDSQVVSKREKSRCIQ